MVKLVKCNGGRKWKLRSNSVHYAMAKIFLVYWNLTIRIKSAAMTGVIPAKMMAPKYLPPWAAIMAEAMGAPRRFPKKTHANAQR